MLTPAEFGEFRKDKDVILFYTPEAKITPHMVAQCTLARALQDEGYKVLMARCRGQFSRCPVIDSVRPPYTLTIEQQHQSFCNECVAHSEAITRHYDLPVIDLGSYFSDDHMQLVQQSIQSYEGGPVDFEFDGVSWGYLGASEFAMMNKHSDMSNLTEEQRHAWAVHTANGMLSYLAVKSLCEDLPVKRICSYNPYVVLVGAAVAAMKLGIPFLNTGHAAHLDIDRQRIRIVPTIFSVDCFYNWAIDWYRWKDLALSESLVKEIVDDSIVRQFGKGAQHYSPAKTDSCDKLYETLHLDRSKQTIVAFTSSLDEYRTSTLRLNGFEMPDRFRLKPFKDQIEWLSEVVSFVEDSEDLQLVVRIHPRESANKRENKVSQHLGLLREAFDKPWKNCRFIWPQDPVSSYDLAELADLVLTSWSTIGLEMARQGVPVVTAYRHYNCIDDSFLPWGGEDKQEYFETLTKRLNTPVPFEDIVGAFRAYNYMTLGTALLLDDVIPEKNFMLVPDPILRTKQAKNIEEIFIHGKEVPSINLKELKQAQKTDSQKLEYDSILSQINRLIHFYSVGEDIEKDLKIYFFEAKDSSETQIIELAKKYTPQGDTSGVFFWSGKNYVYYYDGEFYPRHSALVTRMASILNNVFPETRVVSPVDELFVAADETSLSIKARVLNF